jgi:hypothetical protein
LIEEFRHDGSYFRPAGCGEARRATRTFLARPHAIAGLDDHALARREALGHHVPR